MSQRASKSTTRSVWQTKKQNRIMSMNSFAISTFQSYLDTIGRTMAKKPSRRMHVKLMKRYCKSGLCSKKVIRRHSKILRVIDSKIHQMLTSDLERFETSQPSQIIPIRFFTDQCLSSSSSQSSFLMFMRRVMLSVNMKMIIDAIRAIEK